MDRLPISFRPLGRCAVAGAMLAVGLSGCGSDGDGALSEQAFRTSANEICAEGAAEIGEAVGAVFGSSEPTPETMQEALDTIVRVTRRDIDAIGALAAPDSINEDVDAFLIEGRSATDIAEAQGLGFWDNGGDPWTATNDMAADLGLDVCASS